LVFLLKRVRKKLDKIEKPSFVHDISCTSIGKKIKRKKEKKKEREIKTWINKNKSNINKILGFGPRLPIIKNIQLQSLSPQGEVQLEGEFVYHGKNNKHEWMK